MLVSARDRENRVLHGATQNGKAQFPKTPGQGPSKTPFAGRKGDENAAGLMPIPGKTTFKAHAEAFQTPMGPQSRVPLGGKDTNLKAKHNLLYNDPLQQTTKPNKAGPASDTKQSARARRQTRLSITPKTLTSEDDELPEIEYIPPAPQDLPDIPDDYTRIDVSIVKQNLFRDANSTPMYDARRREQFRKLTEYDESKEEEELRLKVEAMLFEMEKGTDKGKDAWKELDTVDFGDTTVRQKKTPSTRAYEGATKSSMAKRGPPRPASALSNKSGNSGSMRKASTIHTRKPSAHIPARVQIPRENPRTGLVPSLSKHGDYHNAVGRKLGLIYHDELMEAKRKVETGECGVNDIDYDELEERALRENEKKITPKEDIEQKMRDLFRMDEEEEEVYQIPLDF
ncbi:hypothetical protein TWF694_011088 [Orbilia ellipsospora]|uniref:Uncharacterized protein n=1 Tax=Orbilia ellipsospora TaxID=2528407 RepID=A0AAV9XB16_9PEZI